MQKEGKRQEKQTERNAEEKPEKWKKAVQRQECLSLSFARRGVHVLEFMFLPFVRTGRFLLFYSSSMVAGGFPVQS